MRKKKEENRGNHDIKCPDIIENLLWKIIAQEIAEKLMKKTVLDTKCLLTSDANVIKFIMN